MDAQLDPIQLSTFEITFNPLDLPDDKFIFAGNAYKMCIANKANPDNFGVDFNIRGLGHIQGNILLDFLSLNKLEFLPWDHVKFLNGIFNSSKEISEENVVRSVLQNSISLGFEEIKILYFSSLNFHFNLEWVNIKDFQ